MKTTLVTLIVLTSLLILGFGHLRAARVKTAPNPQITGCYNWDTSFNECGNNPTCGLGDYRSNEFPTGPGLKGVVFQSAACEGSTCPSVPNVPTAVDNTACVTPTPTPIPVSCPFCPDADISDCPSNCIGPVDYCQNGPSGCPSVPGVEKELLLVLQTEPNRHRRERQRV